MTRTIKWTSINWCRFFLIYLKAKIRLSANHNLTHLILNQLNNKKKTIKMKIKWKKRKRDAWPDHHVHSASMKLHVNTPLPWIKAHVNSVGTVLRPSPSRKPRRSRDDTRPEMQPTTSVSLKIRRRFQIRHYFRLILPLSYKPNLILKT